MVNNKAKIVIVDDHPLIAEGIKTGLESSDWIANIDIFETTEQCLKISKTSPADLYLLDIQIGKSDGRKLIKPLKELNPHVKIVVLSSFDDAEMIKSVFKAGADAYLIKNISFVEMEHALKSIWNDEKYFQPQVRAVFEELQKVEPTKPSVPRLTPREKDVLKLILAEKTTKEIASSMCLSEKTIESHRATLFIKFDVKNIAGLVKKAIEWGIE